MHLHWYTHLATVVGVHDGDLHRSPRSSFFSFFIRTSPWTQSFTKVLERSETALPHIESNWSENHIIRHLQKHHLWLKYIHVITSKDTVDTWPIDDKECPKCCAAGSVHASQYPYVTRWSEFFQNILHTLEWSKHVIEWYLLYMEIRHDCKHKCIHIASIKFFVAYVYYNNY